jgi:Glycosyltransferase family 87
VTSRVTIRPRVWLQATVAALLVVLLVALARESALHSIDFPVYHRAARQVISGSFTLYPAEAYGGRPGPSQGFRYLPAIAILFVPFGWLPLELAALAFFALKLAALWYIGVTVARHVGLSTGLPTVLLVAFLVVGGYLVEEFRFGNVHFLCIALLVFAYDKVESGHVWLPAAALAVAIATKLTPLALLAYFAFRRRTAVCLAAIAILAVLLVLPAVFIGRIAYERELRAFATYAVEKVDEGDNYSLRGVLFRYLTPGPENAPQPQANIANLSPMIVDGLWLLGVLGLGLFGLRALWRESQDSVVRLIEFSIVLTFMVLASPHTQRRYFVTLYVPAVALVSLFTTATRVDEKRAALIGLLAMAAPATILPLVLGGRTLALLYEASSPYFFGTLLLFATLVALTVHRKAPREAATVR